MIKELYVYIFLTYLFCTIGLVNSIFGYTVVTEMEKNMSSATSCDQDKLKGMQNNLFSLSLIQMIACGLLLLSLTAFIVIKQNKLSNFFCFFKILFFLFITINISSSIYYLILDTELSVCFNPTLNSGGTLKIVSIVNLIVSIISLLITLGYFYVEQVEKPSEPIKKVENKPSPKSDEDKKRELEAKEKILEEERLRISKEKKLVQDKIKLENEQKQLELENKLQSQLSEEAKLTRAQLESLRSQSRSSVSEQSRRDSYGRPLDMFGNPIFGQ